MSEIRAVLKLNEVGRSFGGFSVLKRVSFSVPEGSVVGLIGPNGAGKTTLFNIITGYIPQDSGTIEFDGKMLEAQSVQARSVNGLVRTFQTPKIFEKMTVVENIMSGASMREPAGMLEDLLLLPKARNRMRKLFEIAEEACEKFGLKDIRHQIAQNLPAGQRRILEIARAFVAGPRMMLLDEPSSGLNEEEMQTLSKLIKWLRDTGITILLVSHDMELMNVAERVHVLYFGEIITSGTMSDIQSNPRVREVYLGA